MKPFSFNNRFGLKILEYIKGYHHDKYWKRREEVINPKSKVPLIIRLYYLYYIKKIDSKFGCSFGTNLGSGASFKTPPNLLHGPIGIIIGHDANFGSNVTIAQQVTVAHHGGGLKIRQL